MPQDYQTPRIDDSQVESHPFKAAFHGSEDGTPGYLSVESGYIIPSGFVGGFDAILPKFAGQDLQDQHHTTEVTHITDPPVGDWYVEATGEWRTLGYDGDNKNEMFEPHTAEIKHHSQLDLTHEKKRALKIFKLESDGRVSQYIKSDIPMSLGRSAPAIPPWEPPPDGSGSSRSSSSSSSGSSSSGSRSWWAGSSDSSSGSSPRKWATFRTHEFPPYIYPGVTSNVQVSLRNDGNIPWETSDQLLPMGYHWGTLSISVPVTYPGVVRDFNFEITAPMTPGAYAFSWQLYGAGTYFGEQTPSVDITVVGSAASSSSAGSSSSSGPAPYDRAAFVSQFIIPEEMFVDEEAWVQVTFRNVGTTTWETGMYKLLPQRHDWGNFEIALPTRTPPGVERTFDITMTAPPAPGTYWWQWQMYGPSGVFDQIGAEKAVIVSARPVVPPDSSSSSSGGGSSSAPPSSSGSGSSSGGGAASSGSTPAGDNARFVFQEGVFEELTQGSTADVQITFRNIGSTSWNVPQHKLVSKVPDANTFWGMSEVSMSLPTYSGGERTFYFTITAPETTGYYPFRWQMHTSAEGLFFGDVTPDVQILVTERSSGSSSSS